MTEATTLLLYPFCFVPGLWLKDKEPLHLIDIGEYMLYVLYRSDDRKKYWVEEIFFTAYFFYLTI